MAKGVKTGGRQKGTPNKATADVKEAAQAFTADAISTLAEIMKSPEHPAAARVSAASALLDRGHGKPKQSVDLDANVVLNDVSAEPEVSEAEWTARHVG
jgi:hypothetical protein